MATGRMSGIGFLGGLLKGIAQGRNTEKELALREAYKDIQQGYLNMAEKKLPFDLERMGTENEMAKYNYDMLSSIDALTRGAWDFMLRTGVPLYQSADTYGQPLVDLLNDIKSKLGAPNIPMFDITAPQYSKEKRTQMFQEKMFEKEAKLRKDLAKIRAQNRAAVGGKSGGVTTSQIINSLKDVVNNSINVIDRLAKTYKSANNTDTADLLQKTGLYINKVKAKIYKNAVKDPELAQQQAYAMQQVLSHYIGMVNQSMQPEEVSKIFMEMSNSLDRIANGDVNVNFSTQEQPQINVDNLYQRWMSTFEKSKKSKK